MKYHQISLNHIYSHQISDDYKVFNKAAITTVIKILIEFYRSKRPNATFPDLHNLHKVIWMPAKIENKTFAQRIARFVKDEWDLNLPSEVTTSIGNVAGVHSPIDGEVYFDFVNKFEWRSGDFGDSGSCFWSMRRDIRKAMEDNGNFYAIRIYQPGMYMDARVQIRHMKPDGNEIALSGFGRSWLYETVVTVNINKQAIELPVIILFNAYGLGINQQSLLLASFLRKGRHPVYLTNNNMEHGGLYFNGSGYVIGDAKLIRSINKFDIGLKNVYDDQIVAEQSTLAFQGIVNAQRAVEEVEKRTRRISSAAWRKEIRQDEKANRRYAIINRTIKNGVVNSQTEQYVIKSVNRSIVSSSRPYSSFLHYKDPVVQFARKYEYNPFKIINHKIQYQINKESNHDQSPNHETTANAGQAS